MDHKTSLGFPFRKFLRFSKLKRINSQFNNYTTTSIVEKDLNGKDLYAPKSGNSHYDPQHYHTNFFHTPQCMPNLKEKENEYAELFANPYNAAARGYVDEVIEPEHTRLKLIKAFKMLENKVDTLPKKKHGNIPL